MKALAKCLTAIMVIAAVFVSTAPAAEPTENSIPIIGIRMLLYTDPSLGEADLDLLCRMAWLYFDGIDFAAWSNTDACSTLMAECDSTGMLVLLSPCRIGNFILKGDSAEGPHWVGKGWRSFRQLPLPPG